MGTRVTRTYLSRGSEAGNLARDAGLSRKRILCPSICLCPYSFTPFIYAGACPFFHFSCWSNLAAQQHVQLSARSNSRSKASPGATSYPSFSLGGYFTSGYSPAVYYRTCFWTLSSLGMIGFGAGVAAHAGHFLRLPLYTATFMKMTVTAHILGQFNTWREKSTAALPCPLQKAAEIHPTPIFQV